MALGDRNSRTLFGGDLGWHGADWTASDDRVRGGSSKSNLLCGENGAIFYGHLDIKTLGGAGFASQRTTGELALDLSKYDGIELAVNETETDGKRYTLILKDELLPNNPDNGREQATVSWEYDFSTRDIAPRKTNTDGNLRTVFVAWQSFKATYRGKEKKDAGSLDVSNIKRVSIMMRSFFGTQEGDFRLGLLSIKAAHHAQSLSSYSMEEGDATSWSSTLRKADREPPGPKQTMWHWLLGKCGKL